MKKVQAVYLDESDVVDEQWPCRGLKEETLFAVCEANIVIYRDRVVKNHCGGIGRIVPIVQPVPAEA
jgi:hypothetical protein